MNPLTTQDTAAGVDMATTNRLHNLGKSLDDQAIRADGVAKVTGRAKYGRDVYLPNQIHLVFVRCPFGAGELTDMDIEAARAVPGVLEVTIEGREGRYHGHTVGYIAAESRLQLRRALAALKPAWTRRPVTTTIAENAADPAPMTAETQAALASAEHVLEAIYSTPVQTHSPLETHGAAVDHRGDSATVYSSTQGTFAALDGMPEAIGLPQSKFEIRCEYIGGGFGSKLNGAGKEGILAARIAAKYQRPTYCFTDRAEDHLDTGNRPSSRTWVKIGFNKAGQILGGQIHTWGGTGISGGGGVRIPSGCYGYPGIQRGRQGHQDVQFNAGGPRAFRAPGCPQGTFAEELLLDEIATIAGVDPLAMRLSIDTETDRRAMFELGADLIGWSQRQPTGSQRGPLRRGFGLGACSWGRFPAPAEAEVVINRDGSIEARTGTQDIGTGQRTAMAVIVAKQLGVPTDAVSVAIGSSTLPVGPGSGGSMTAHNTAPAMYAAAEDARAKFIQAAATRLGENADAVTLSGGRVHVHGQPRLTFAEACARLSADAVTGRGSNGDEAGRRFGGEGHSHGVQFVDLTVDADTGVIRVDRIVAIQSCGQVIARKMAESQIIGGVIQGVSYALFEDKILDRHVGAMVNPNLEMYKIAGTNDMPRIEPVLWERGQTGVRSLGEPPTIPTAGAIACAVFNAVGAPVRHLPLTPDKVLAALTEARSTNGGGA